MFFQYILALGCASMVFGQETTPSPTPAVFTNTFSASPFTLPPSLATIGTSLTPAVITNTFSASPYILPSSLASLSTTISSSQTPATTRAVSTSGGTRTTSQTATGTESAATTTSSSSAARKLDQKSWVGPAAVVGVVGWLGYFV